MEIMRSWCQRASHPVSQTSMTSLSNALTASVIHSTPTRGEALWSVDRGISPIIGTAIHNGAHVREEVLELMALRGDERLREEDPFTETTIRDIPNRIVFHRSRFEIDLNRCREEAVYLTPAQAWGMTVWRKQPPPYMIEESLRVHDAYYKMLREMLSSIEADHGRFVLLDIHSYNHRRLGRDAAATNPEEAPEINIGTISMDRNRWAFVVDPFVEALRAFEFCGRRLDVRENIAFQGRGEQTRFVHEHFPASGCAIAIEFKKFFMDEWTGEPDLEALAAMRAMVAATLPLLEDRLLAGR